MLKFIYYFLLSFVLIYLIHQIIQYLKHTFTIPKVLDVTCDYIDVAELNKHIVSQSQSQSPSQSQSVINQNINSETSDIDELTTYLQNITR